jgi:hypothetical protein
MSRKGRHLAASREKPARPRGRGWQPLAIGGAAIAVLAVAGAVAVAEDSPTPGGAAAGSTKTTSMVMKTASSPKPGSGLATMSSMPTMGTTPVTGAAAPKLKPLSTLGKLKSAPAPGSVSYEGVPVPPAPALAGTSEKTTGQTIDGIQCQANEQLVYHVHAHLTIFVQGKARQIPMAIGIPDAQQMWSPEGNFIDAGTCFYWLHTHAPDGIIHIESPTERTYTLGQFFAEWGQPLSTSQVGPDRGHVTALFNGQVYTGDPRDIPLDAHAQIQLEIGTPLIAPEKITFPGGL